MIAADLLRHHLFPDFELLGGSGGLNRELSSVSVIDAPDVDRWMRGGEFLIGSGYIFREDPEGFAPFLRRVEEKGIAALGIKLDRYHHQLPGSMVAESDSLNLPLVAIPLNYRWTDVIEGVQAFLFQEKRRVDQAPEDLGSFWEEGLDLRRLLSGFALRLGLPLVVQSTQLGLNHQFLPDGRIEGADQVQAFLKAPVVQEKGLPRRGQILENLELRNSGVLQWCAVYRFVADTPLTLHLGLSAGEQTPSTRQERMVLRALTLLRAAALEVATLSDRWVVKKEKFFEGLCLDIYNDPEMVRANLEELGVALPRRGCIVVASSSREAEPPRWVPPEAVFSHRLGDQWTGLLPLPDPDGAKRDWGQKAERAGVHLALGGTVQTPLEISRSYQEAKRTSNWLREFSLPPGVYLHEELSLYALLDSLARLPEARGVYRRYWEPLLAEPTGGRRSLPLRELAKALIQTDFNARLCAQNLHLHYNTVRNHLEDLEGLLDLDLSNPHHRLGLILASHIHGSFQKRGGEG